MLNAELSVEDRICLDEFVSLRANLLREIGSNVEEDLPFYKSTQHDEVGTHELLIAEVKIHSLQIFIHDF